MTNYTVVKVSDETNTNLHQANSCSKEALGEDTTPKPSRPLSRQVSLINRSSGTSRVQPGSSLYAGTSIDEITQKFTPSPRKFLSEQTKIAARQHHKEFMRLDLTSDLPTMILEPTKGGNGVSTMKGPGHSSADVQMFGDHCCCRTISSYPPKPDFHQRMGDPICDRYFVKLYENRIICGLADGCSWGERARSAAKKACKAFVLYMNANQKAPKNLQELGRTMLEGFADAHRKILETSNEAVWEAGTTTLNGSVLLRASPGDLSMKKWIFVSCNLGDCKAFYYSKQTKKVRDITLNTRDNIQESGDPGGRLGPRGDSKPDLRNLSLFWQYCEEDDYVFIVSDGVYDNCDLRHQGYLPKDFDLPGDTWDDVDPKKVNNMNCKHVEGQLTKVIRELGDNLVPSDICVAITDFCLQITENSRQFMVNNPNSRLPKDYTKYPGKVDHTSVVCFRVGEVSLSYDQWMGK